MLCLQGIAGLYMANYFKIAKKKKYLNELTEVIISVLIYQYVVLI